MPEILIVDDEKKMRHLLSIMLERRGYGTSQAQNGLEALEKIMAGSYDLVISDIKMPGMDGRELLERIRKEDCPVPVVFITAFATVDSAVECMCMGACDYITKPFDEEKLRITVERALGISKVLRENQALRKELEFARDGHEFIFVSKPMKSIIELADKVAATDSAVLITGESGTGKELLARYLHKQSQRSKERFVPVNCAAISPNLVESELFGYEKGAFTGAVKRTQGKFEFASGGTLFLDEIGDLPLESQGKFLRALQERRIQRVGGHEEIPVNARVVCATNRDLAAMVKGKEFRQDLYYRINVFPIELPTLAQRRDDIIPLARFFLKKLQSFEEKIELTPGAEKVLTEYGWPGNVRELANIMERAFILAQGSDEISRDTLSFLNARDNEFLDSESVDFSLPPEGVSLERLEKRLVEQALRATSNNQTKAADMLGLTRSKFRVLMKNFLSD